MTNSSSIHSRPYRTVQIHGLAFEGFPNDDALWWLRWLDYGAATTSSRSSLLHLLFSRLPDGSRAAVLPTLDSQLAAASAPLHRAETHIGWLPILRIGLVVHNGRVVGELGAEIRCFRFEAPYHEEHMELLLHSSREIVEFRRNTRRRLPNKDRMMEIGDRPGLLHPSDYPLPGITDGRLLAFGPAARFGGGSTLVLPCAEIVRVAYAPHAALARAVIDHFWSERVSRVFDMSRTGASPGGDSWQVAPFAPLRAEHITVAANLAINPVARERANLVRAEVHLAPKGVLAAVLPFEWTVLELHVACVRLSPDGQGERWLGIALLGWQWPPHPQGPPPRITWAPPGDRRAGQTRQTSSGRPFPPSSGRKRTRGPKVRSIKAVQNADPAATAALDVISLGVTWRKTPEVIKIDRASSVKPVGDRDLPIRSHAGGSGGGQIAAAEPGRTRGGLKPAPADPQTVSPDGNALLPSLRFQEVLAMLERLKADDALQTMGVEAARGADLEQRGDVAAWAFPEVPVNKKDWDDSERSWFVRDFPSTRPRLEMVRRSAMVCRLGIGNRVVYWLEIEPRNDYRDRYRSLIFTASGAMQVPSVIKALLWTAAERSGVWLAPALLKRRMSARGEPGIVECATWRHERVRTDQRVPMRLCPLSGPSALEAIQSVFALQPCTR